MSYKKIRDKISAHSNRLKVERGEISKLQDELKDREESLNNVIDALEVAYDALGDFE